MRPPPLSAPPRLRRCPFSARMLTTCGNNDNGAASGLREGEGQNSAQNWRTQVFPRRTRQFLAQYGGVACLMGCFPRLRQQMVLLHAGVIVRNLATKPSRIGRTRRPWDCFAALAMTDRGLRCTRRCLGTDAGIVCRAAGCRSPGLNPPLKENAEWASSGGRARAIAGWKSTWRLSVPGRFPGVMPGRARIGRRLPLWDRGRRAHACTRPWHYSVNFPGL